MAERFLLCVMHNGDWVVVQYGQWDLGTHPRSVRSTLLRFLRDPANVTALRQGLAHTYLATQKNLVFFQTQVHRRMDQSNINWKRNLDVVRNTWLEMYPSLCHVTGGDILQHIAKATSEKRLPMVLWNMDFLLNTTMCHATYVVDLDAGLFEIYEAESAVSNSDGPHRFRDIGPKHHVVPGMVASFRFVELATFATIDGFHTKIERMKLKSDKKKSMGKMEKSKDGKDGKDDGDGGDEDDSDDDSYIPPKEGVKRARKRDEDCDSDNESKEEDYEDDWEAESDGMDEDQLPAELIDRLRAIDEQNLAAKEVADAKNRLAAEKQRAAQKPEPAGTLCFLMDGEFVFPAAMFV